MSPLIAERAFSNVQTTDDKITTVTERLETSDPILERLKSLKITPPVLTNPPTEGSLTDILVRRPSTSQASACVIENKMIVFGGESGNGLLDEMQVLNFDKFSWTAVSSKLYLSPSSLPLQIPVCKGHSLVYKYMFLSIIVIIQTCLINFSK